MKIYVVIIGGKLFVVCFAGSSSRKNVAGESNKTKYSNKKFRSAAFGSDGERRREDNET